MIHVKSRRVKLIELCEPMVPAREAAMRGFTMAILVTLSALGAGQPVAAEDPLPAGYERWMAPDAKHVRTGGSTQSYSGVWFNIGFNKGSFIVDFDVTSYDPKPTTKDNSGDLYYKDHVFSALEVTNKGLLGVGETNGKPNDWVFAYGQNEEGMAWVLNQGPPSLGADLPVFPYLGNDLPALRPTSFELYFRHNPFTGEEEPTFAFVAVENIDKHFADWEFVPPMPIDVLQDLLDDLPASTRPYEVEFAKDKNGFIWGSALLTHDEVSGGLPVPWGTMWFQPWQLNLLALDGWQLMDMELNPGVFPGYFEGFFEKSDWPPYFGVFVHTGFVTDELTQANVGDPTNSEFIEAIGAFGGSRLIDQEYAGTGDKESAGKQTFFPGPFQQAEAPIHLYATAWLSEDE